MKFNMRFIIMGIVLLSVTVLSFLPQDGFDLKASMERGKEVYATYCLSCHMEEGEGLEGVYPPVAKSDYMMADVKRSIQEILYGVTGEMKVNGIVYNTDMPGYDLSDEEASDVLNYIRNSWGNKGASVLPKDVKAARKPL